MDEYLTKVIAAAREATADTHNIPSCVELAQALRDWDKSRGAICAMCDGSCTFVGPEGDESSCTLCGGSGLVEPTPLVTTEVEIRQAVRKGVEDALGNLSLIVSNTNKRTSTSGSLG